MFRSVPQRREAREKRNILVTRKCVDKFKIRLRSDQNGGHFNFSSAIRTPTVVLVAMATTKFWIYIVDIRIVEENNILFVKPHQHLTKMLRNALERVQCCIIL